jgi:hypothetical protein
VFNLGHAAVADIFRGGVVVEEKVDGSQFSFGIIDGELQCRSKGKDQDVDGGADKMFQGAVEYVKTQALVPGWTYRGELFTKPKHNTLCYSRVPNNGVVLFDIDTKLETYLSQEELEQEAAAIGLEAIPTLKTGEVKDYQELHSFLERESFLGGTTIEGVVIKAYGRYGEDGKTLMGKYVSEAFKEKHQKSWKLSNPTNKDVIALLGEELRTEARWEKAIQHLRERGELLNEPKDIGPLLKEINIDVREEEGDYIKQKLFDYAWKHLSRTFTAGFPQWYKDKLAQSAFEED